MFKILDGIIRINIEVFYYFRNDCGRIKFVLVIGYKSKKKNERISFNEKLRFHQADCTYAGILRT